MRRRKYKTINPRARERGHVRSRAFTYKKKEKKKGKKKKEKTKEKKKKGKNGGLETRGGLEGAVWRMKNPRASCGNVDITVDGEFPFTDSGVCPGGTAPLSRLIQTRVSSTAIWNSRSALSRLIRRGGSGAAGSDTKPLDEEKHLCPCSAPGRTDD